MVIYKEGDKSQGICEKCKKIVTTTFKYAPLKYKGAIVNDILQDFCDICGESISIPPQSTYRIKEYRESLNKAVEFRVPMHLIDILVAIGTVLKLSQKPNFICRVISEFYLTKLEKNDHKSIQRKFYNSLKDDLIKGKAVGRLSCTFNDTTYSILKSLAEKEKVMLSQVEKSIIITAKHDLLDNEDKELVKEFKDFALTKL